MRALVYGLLTGVAVYLIYLVYLAVMPSKIVEMDYVRMGVGAVITVLILVLAFLHLNKTR